MRQIGEAHRVKRDTGHPIVGECLSGHLDDDAPHQMFFHASNQCVQLTGFRGRQSRNDGHFPNVTFRGGGQTGDHTHLLEDSLEQVCRRCFAICASDTKNLWGIVVRSVEPCTDFTQNGPRILGDHNRHTRMSSQFRTLGVGQHRNGTRRDSVGYEFSTVTVHSTQCDKDVPRLNLAGHHRHARNFDTVKAPDRPQPTVSNHLRENSRRQVLGTQYRWDVSRHAHYFQVSGKSGVGVVDGGTR